MFRIRILYAEETGNELQRNADVRLCWGEYSQHATGGWDGVEPESAGFPSMKFFLDKVGV